ncbi:MAG: Fur family transcriptional regulator [Dethiobacteria bacterium]|jgi:Fur family peroxide stress response transcriptional regulator
MQSIEEALRRKRIKVTPQRMAVYAILKQTKIHPNVEMIYQKLKPDYPAMSLATVYKTVDILKRVGLIQELNIGEGGLRYDASTVPHSHLYCKNCGQIKDLEHLLFNEVKNEIIQAKIKEDTGFEVLSVQICFYGLCSQCR